MFIKVKCATALFLFLEIMIKIPDKVKVGGLIYQIKEVDEIRNGDCIGFWEEGECLILIQRDLPKSVKELTFIHELLHALFEFMQWDHNEKKIEQLSAVLHMVIKDNPGIFNDSGTHPDN